MELEIKTKIYCLELPQGIFYCNSMSTMYAQLREYYPEFLRSKRLRLGKKNIGDVRTINLMGDKKIILRVLPLYGLKGRTTKKEETQK